MIYKINKYHHCSRNKYSTVNNNKKKILKKP